jgi:hypothetical protein
MVRKEEVLIGVKKALGKLYRETSKGVAKH